MTAAHVKTTQHDLSWEAAHRREIPWLQAK